MQIVSSSSVTFTLQTDLGNDQSNASAVLHAKSNSVGNHDEFMWIDDINNTEFAMNHFIERGYESNNLVCIPYSHKENWLKAYPFIVPTLECDNKGEIRLFQSDGAAAFARVPSLPPMSVKKASLSNLKKRKRGGPRIYKNAILTNDLRDELHIQVYKYFQWLLHILCANASSHNGRIKLSECGFSTSGIQTMLSTMESVFHIVKSAPKALFGRENEFPLLEQAVENELGKLADERLDNTEPQAYHAQWYDFDEMIIKLQEYRKLNGHCRVPIRFKDDRRLGKWVQKLREKRTELSKKGEEFESPRKNNKLTSRTLTKERVQRLDDLGFEWRVKTTPQVSWDIRFRELIEFYQTYGKWPSRKNDGSIGVWAHNQRNHYTKKDKHFMTEKYAKLDEIGFDWDPVGKRGARELTWNKGFEQLVSLC